MIWKRILGMDPLEITVLRCGTFASYRKRQGKTLRHINPSIHDIQEMIKMQAAFDGAQRYLEILIV